MTTDELDPLIHVPTRLKIVATLAALPDGDTLSFTRLQDMIGLTPGNLIIHLRKLEDADYISSEKDQQRDRVHHHRRPDQPRPQRTRRLHPGAPRPARRPVNRARPTMSTGALDPLIHDPERLRIVATLAALPDGDALSVTRLQDMIGLPPGSLIIRLRELGHAGYVRTGKTGGDKAQTTVALTREGRAALDRYTAVLRQLPQVASAGSSGTSTGRARWRC